MQQVIVVTNESGRYHGVFANELLAERSAKFSCHKLNVVKEDREAGRYTLTVRDPDGCERQLVYMMRSEIVNEEVTHL